MAIFASTTTSGYSDPLKAMNIKALEQRLKDQQAQQAAQQPDAAMMATIPGGIGHVLGVVGDKMAQARTEQAAAANREVLAKAMTGYDMNSGAPPPAEIATVAPDVYKDLLQTWAENRRAAATDATSRRGQDLSRESSAEGHNVTRQTNQATVDATLAGQSNQAAMETARLEAAKAAAAEKARTDEIAKGQEQTFTAAQAAQKRLDDEVAAAAQEKRLQERPTDLDAVKADRALARGEITQETRDAIVNKITGPSATEMKAGNELQNSALGVQGALTDLKEARDLMGPEGTGIRAGTGAGFTQFGSKIVGDTLGLSDPTLTKNTERFNQLVNAQAIEAMVEKLKGSSTDFELREFKALMNDPNADPVNKVKAINRMIEKAEAHLALQQEQMKRAKVPVPAGAGGAAAAAPQAASQDAAALEWANANPNDPRAAAIKQRLGK